MGPLLPSYRQLDLLEDTRIMALRPAIPGMNIESGRKWAVKDIPPDRIVNDDQEAGDVEFVYTVGLQERVLVDQNRHLERAGNSAPTN